MGQFCSKKDTEAGAAPPYSRYDPHELPEVELPEAELPEVKISETPVLDEIASGKKYLCGLKIRIVKTKNLLEIEVVENDGSVSMFGDYFPSLSGFVQRNPPPSINEFIKVLCHPEKITYEIGNSLFVPDSEKIPILSRRWGTEWRLKHGSRIALLFTKRDLHLASAFVQACYHLHTLDDKRVIPMETPGRMYTFFKNASDINIITSETGINLSYDGDNWCFPMTRDEREYALWKIQESIM